MVEQRPLDWPHGGLISFTVQLRAGEPEYGMRRARERLQEAFHGAEHKLDHVLVNRDGDSWLLCVCAVPVGPKDSA